MEESRNELNHETHEGHEKEREEGPNTRPDTSRGSPYSARHSGEWRQACPALRGVWNSKRTELNTVRPDAHRAA